MAFKTEHLVGKKFIFGKQDCFSTHRNFYGTNFDLWVKDYARPENFWKKGYNPIMDNFYDEGFRTVTEHPKDWKAGDSIIMALQGNTANHLAVLMEDGNILHHMWDRISCIESYNRPLYRDRTVAVMRHPLVTEKIKETPVPQQDLLELLPASLRERFRKMKENSEAGE